MRADLKEVPMKSVPEAQLQAYVLGLLRDTFFHLKPDDFRVEKRFKLKLGHSEQDHDGTALWEAEGRADILVFHKDRPLAVLELKREDKQLEDGHVDQGRSYAVQMLDRPPLVIVSNGNDTWVRQTVDGAPLDPNVDGVAFVENVFENMGKIAASNLGWAIEVLMGPETTVWVEAVRQRTDELIAQRTGEPLDARKPYPRGILFRRRVTSQILDNLDAGERAILLEGPPLSGKSNVLLELALACRASPDWAILMINAATHGPGLFQRIANLLGNALDWKVSAEDVRTWLRRMSNSPRRPSLVLAVDGVRPGSPVAIDLEELAETGYGRGLRIVATCDRASELLSDATGRGETSLAGLATVLGVSRLDDQEFQLIREKVAQDRILFYGGAELSDEYRAPWVLRTVLGGGCPPDDPDTLAVLPASMGVRFIQEARRRLEALGDVARLHRMVARDALSDEIPQSMTLALAQANAFIVRRDGLSAAGEQAAQSLETDGWVSFYRDHGGDDVMAFRVPEFFMSELALELTELIAAEIEEDPEEAAATLIWQCHRFFLGDIIGAQAIVDLIQQRRRVPADFIGLLMNDSPETETMVGKHIAVPGPDGRLHYHLFDEHGGIAKADEHGNPLEPFHPIDDDEDAGASYNNMTSWMILSQLARIRIGFDGDQRLDAEIILHVGQSKIPLVHPGTVDAPKAIEMQNKGAAGTILSPAQALAEPLTTAIHALIAKEWRTLDEFFQQMLDTHSFALTTRFHNVLASLRSSADPGLAAWATAKQKMIIPLLNAQLAAETN
jgi:hypothetical protein